METILLAASFDAARAAGELETMASRLADTDPNRSIALELAGVLRATAERLDGAEVF